MEFIHIETTVNASLEDVWNAWITPANIQQWNQASPDWHCPAAANDLRSGGKFTFQMAAKDGSFSFEFGGTHSSVVRQQSITSVLEDGRKMSVSFETTEDGILVKEAFEPENENPLELQKNGWQAILNSFKNHVESNQ